jgi:hypothetical protein
VQHRISRRCAVTCGTGILRIQMDIARTEFYFFRGDADSDSDSDLLDRGTVRFARVLGVSVRSAAVSYHTS